MQILEHKKPSDIIRESSFKQIHGRLSDGENGRCVQAIFMSYVGWDGKYFTADTPRLKETVDRILGGPEVRRQLVLRNDRGDTLEQLADWLDVYNS